MAFCFVVGTHGKGIGSETVPQAKGGCADFHGQLHGYENVNAQCHNCTKLYALL